MDEREHIQKLRRLKVIITEVLMVIATILLVVALTFVVMGYSFNLCEFARGGGEVIERTGLLQIASLPTGATIGIDGGTPLLLRTNASRTVVSGEHEITLTKDGYDSWKKVVNVSEGMMYRLNYPRLFLLEREEEEILDLKGYTFISVAPSKTKILFGKEGKLYVATLVAKPVVKELAAVAQKIETFEEIGWSGNSEKLVAKVNGEVYIINTRAAEESVRLGSIFGGKVDEVKFESETGDRVLVKSEGKVVEIDIKSKTVGLVGEGVEFDNDGERVVFVSKEKAVKKSAEEDTDGTEGGSEGVEAAGEGLAMMAARVGEEAYQIGVVSEGAKVLTMKYYQEMYFLVVEGRKVRVLMAQGWPVSEEEVSVVYEGEVEFSVERIEKRGKGMVFVVEGAEKVAVFDIEALVMEEYEAKEGGWLNEFMRYEIDEGELFAVDYDGNNRRAIVEKAENSGEEEDGENLEGEVSEREEGSGEASGVVSGAGVEWATFGGRYLYFVRGGKLIREKVY